MNADDRTVQVPVSLIKEARSLLLDLAHRRSSEDVSVVEIKQTVYAVLALLNGAVDD